MLDHRSRFRRLHLPSRKRPRNSGSTLGRFFWRPGSTRTPFAGCLLAGRFGCGRKSRDRSIGCYRSDRRRITSSRTTHSNPTPSAATISHWATFERSSPPLPGVTRRACQPAAIAISAQRLPTKSVIRHFVLVPVARGFVLDFTEVASNHVMYSPTRLSPVVYSGPAKTPSPMTAVHTILSPGR